MLQRVTIIRMNGDELILPLTDVSQGISVQSIDGLDPVSATLASSPFAQRDGEYFHSSRRTARDIKYTFGLEPSFGAGTVRDIRQKVYAFFMPKTNIRMRFRMDDGTLYDIWGRVETCESPMFTQQPMVNVSVRCFDPDFFKTGWVNKAINSTSGSSPNVVQYGGSVDSGFILSGSLPRAMNGFTLQNTTSDSGIERFVIEYPFEANDHVTITTTPGEKDAVVRGGGYTRIILYGVTPQSKFWSLHPGRNEVRLITSGSQFSLNMGYTEKYGGL